MERRPLQSAGLLERVAPRQLGPEASAFQRSMRDRRRKRSERLGGFDAQSDVVNDILKALVGDVLWLRRFRNILFQSSGNRQALDAKKAIRKHAATKAKEIGVPEDQVVAATVDALLGWIDRFRAKLTNLEMGIKRL